MIFNVRWRATLIKRDSTSKETNSQPSVFKAGDIAFILFVASKVCFVHSFCVSGCRSSLMNLPAEYSVWYRYLYVTSVWRWYRIISKYYKHINDSLHVACTIDTMHLLGITFILYNYRVSVNFTQTHLGVCTMAQWLMLWTPIGDHWIVFVLS